MAEQWITANRRGLANTLSNIERKKILEEAVQNALDTDATEVHVNLTPPKRGYSTLTVEDNDPKGFEDLSLAYEMFADTAKRSDPTKAGRFTIGEKRILALCKSASIQSTTGTIVFSIQGGKESRIRNGQKRPAGTLATFDVEMTEEQYESALASLDNIIPHDRLKLIFNGVEVPHREPIKVFKATLQTEKANDERKMVKVQRETDIHLHEAKEQAYLYELGIPVVEIDCKWHIDVRQRVPLNSDRDNVTPAYLQKLLALVLNEAHSLLSKEDAGEDWVHVGMGADDLEKSAYEDIKTKVYGEKTLIANPLDPESIARGVAEGYNVIYPRSLSNGERDNNKRFGTIPTSSTVFPTKGAYSTDPNAPMVKVVDEGDWTEGMRKIHAYTEALGKKLLDVEVSVRFVNTTNGFAACWGCCQMDYNIFRLGKHWFDNGMSESVDALIIHEFAHHFESNHLDENYYKACCKLGARLKKLALENPKFFEEFS